MQHDISGDEVKKLIVFDKKHSAANHPCDRYELLFRRMVSELGFDLIFKEQVFARDLAGYDIVLVKGRTYLLKENHCSLETYLNMPKDKIFIPYYSDLQTDNSDKFDAKYEANWTRILDRADIILTAYNEYFGKRWGNKYDSKKVWFPHFVARERYETLPFNTNPIMQCIISGKVTDIYPLRKTIIKTAVANNDKRFYWHQHPGYKLKEAKGSIVIGDDFSKLLNKYFCGIATHSRYGYVLGKYFEIAAAGCLLLGKRCADLDGLGFEPQINYVEIDEENYSCVLDKVLAYPKTYDRVRMDGRDHVLQNHTIGNRIGQIKDILKEKL